MKKEIIYLSLPDHFNKFLLFNFNQKFNLKDNINLYFKLSNNIHLGSALKAVYLLEILFPQKSLVTKIVFKKKKLIFGQKVKNSIFFTFKITMSSIDFVDSYKFFPKNPIIFNKKNDLSVVNRKLKQFEFNNNIFINSLNSSNSFFFFQNYHVN